MSPVIDDGSALTYGVVIPVFNRHEYLEEALSSVRAQTLPPDQIVLVDDGSSREETVEFLDRIDQGGGISLVRIENRGPGGAFNAGRAKLGTDAMLFLADDDLIAPEYAEEAMSVLAADRSVGVVYCNAVMFGDEQGERPWLLPPYDPRTIVLDNMVHAAAVVRLRDYDAVGGYDQSLRSGREDHDLWLRMTAARVGFHRLDKPMFRYRQTPGSVNRQFGTSIERMAETYGRISRNSPDLYLQNMDVLWAEIFRLRTVVRRYDRLYGRFDNAASRTRRRLRSVLSRARRRGRRGSRGGASGDAAP